MGTGWTPLGGTCGSICLGMFRSFKILSSHCSVARSIISVREALVTSVACTVPPVRLYSSHVSMVPNKASPACRGDARHTAGQRDVVRRSVRCGAVGR